MLTIRGLATHRGHIKKIKFGPGRGNTKLGALYADGIDIWDLQKVFCHLFSNRFIFCIHTTQ